MLKAISFFFASTMFAVLSFVLVPFAVGLNTSELDSSSSDNDSLIFGASLLFYTAIVYVFLRYTLQAKSPLIVAVVSGLAFLTTLLIDPQESDWLYFILASLIGTTLYLAVNKSVANS